MKLADLQANNDEEVKQRNLIEELKKQLEQDKKDLEAAQAYQYEVSGTNAGLIAGLIVVILAVCGAGGMILKKRRDDYWLDDENEGGDTEDYYKRFIDEEK